MDESRAPRFRAFLDRTQGALFMPRDEWVKFVLQENSPVEIDISSTPMRSLVHATDIVGSFAERNENGEILITIFRNDPKDAPNHINVDKFAVWEETLFRNDYPKVVRQSSTSDDSELRSFVSDYVVILPLDKGTDHDLPDIPLVYKARIEDKRNT